MKTKNLLFVALISATLCMQANSYVYEVWPNNYSGSLHVNVSSPTNPIRIKNGTAIVPIIVSTGYNVEGMKVHFDLYRNGRSATDSSAFMGWLKGRPGNWYIKLDNVRIWYPSIVDGLYQVRILPD